MVNAAVLGCTVKNRLEPTTEFSVCSEIDIYSIDRSCKQFILLIDINHVSSAQNLHLNYTRGVILQLFEGSFI